MKIYRNEILVGDLPTSIKSPDRWWNKLVGIDVSDAGKKLTVTGRYQSFIEIERHPSCDLIIIAQRLFVLVRNTRPYIKIHFIRTNNDTNE